ncbi:RNA polymerase sigma factor RpoE [Candidatus Spongiihabitans sp.]|uniref:RNA polymerase sigma factor RpoE n=1 Tax=Candidatus Spongiihabitans sp. TaxID=3101308 RepID=UPI003C7E3EC5
MDQDENDITLVQRVQNGDKQAFNLLVEKYQFRVKHVVGRFVKDVHEQEDIVQESFIKAYRAISRFRGDSAFYTWLYRIAVNTAKNYLVATSRRPPAQDVIVDEMVHSRGAERLVEANSPEQIVQNDQLVEAIKQSISALPEELKQAIELRELDGLSYEDIAVAMNCPIGTVRSRIFRAREAVERAIADLVES